MADGDREEETKQEASSEINLQPGKEPLKESMRNENEGKMRHDGGLEIAFGDGFVVGKQVQDNSD